MELWRVIDGGAQLRTKAPHLLPTLPYVVEDLAALTEGEIDQQFPSPAVRLALHALKNDRRGEGVRTLRLTPEEAALIPPMSSRRPYAMFARWTATPGWKRSEKPFELQRFPQCRRAP
jgi:hypothetical protein